MKTIVNSLETLEAIVTGAGSISTYQHPPKGYDVEVWVYGGVVDLTNAVVTNMCIRFVGCEIKGHRVVGGFVKCNLYLQDVIGTVIRFSDCVTVVERSDLHYYIVDSGEMHIRDDNELRFGSICPRKLYADSETIVDLHEQGGNSIGFQTMLGSATASCGSFGTYNGNVHYFKESDTVIAGCWIGTLEEFPIKAKERAVDPSAYETVYNHFKACN